MKTETKTLLKNSALLLGTFGAICSAQASADYGPAIWNPPGCVKYYTSGYGTHFAVIHDMEGYYLASISYLNNCNVSASVHYAVNGKQDTSTDAPAGQITQMISEAYYAWHVGCWNLWMYGTEHEGFASNPAWYTDAMYNATIGLQRHLATVGDGSPFAMDRNHIIGHNEWQNQNWRNWMAGNYPSVNTGCNTHTDPGPYWDWNRLITGMNAVGNLWSVAISKNLDGRLQIFEKSPANTLRTKWQTAVNGGWSGWNDMGGTFLGVPAVGTNYDGRMQVFVRGTDNVIYSVWQTTVNGTFSGWGNMGGNCVSAVGTGHNADGRMQIFTRSSGSTVWSCWQTNVNGAFSGWSNFGGSCMDTPHVGSNADGRMQVFTMASDNTVWTSWQTSKNGIFSGWSGMGGSCAGAVGVGHNADGRLQIFTQTTGNNVWSCWQTSVNGAFSGWNSMGGSCQAFPTIGNDADGRMEIFTRATDNTIWQAWQTSPNGVFSGWNGIGN